MWSKGNYVLINEGRFLMQYPLYRPRRLRQNENFRRMVQETRLSLNNLVMPFFVRPGKSLKKPIFSMPGNYQLSIDNLIKEVKEAKNLGIPAVILFGIPNKKDNMGTEAYAEDGIVQQAILKIKKKVPNILVITDVCLCQYTSHGHCGIVKKGRRQKVEVCEIDNDATLGLLAKIALSHARAGADMVAPSAMMDGQVKVIRSILDKKGYTNIPIMVQSVKYASSFYGPFRKATKSSLQFGDKKSYQVNIANVDEALREVSLDIQEGADIVMIKPALAYLDIICQVKVRFNIPLAAYNVSGECAMVKAAGKFGWFDEDKVILEILAGIKRAGADIIITYHAKEMAAKLSNIDFFLT